MRKNNRNLRRAMPATQIFLAGGCGNYRQRSGNRGKAVAGYPCWNHLRPLRTKSPAAVCCRWKEWRPAWVAVFQPKMCRRAAPDLWLGCHWPKVSDNFTVWFVLRTWTEGINKIMSLWVGGGKKTKKSPGIIRGISWNYIWFYNAVKTCLALFAEPLAAVTHQA